MRDSSSGDKLKIAHFGDLSLEEAIDLSRDRQRERERMWGEVVRDTTFKGGQETLSPV
jgi:hypothetical protein